MRKSWRTWGWIVLVGAWPHLGCHQFPADKSVQDTQPRPIQKDSVSAKKLELTTSDITQTAWLNNVDALEKDRKHADAIKLCEQMRQPGSPYAAQATRRLALIHERLGDSDRAEQEYRWLLQQNPKDADSLAKIGDLYKQRGQWGTAFNLYSQAVQYKPDHVSARSGLAMALAQTEDYKGSLEEYKKILPESEAHCEVAFVLQMQGKTRDAMRAYEAALNKQPSMPRAAMELARLRLTDTPPSLTQSQSGSKGIVVQETAPARASEGVSRHMDRLPTLPPLSDVYQIPVENEPTSGRKQ